MDKNINNDENLKQIGKNDFTRSKLLKHEINLQIEINQFLLVQKSQRQKRSIKKCCDTLILQIDCVC